MSGFVYVSSMRTTNGTFLGKIYAKYLTDDVFTDLYILGSNDEVLYKIDKSGFFNQTGVEREMRGVGFYGFKFALKSSDHIVVTPLYDEGRDVSDDVTIRWNSGNNDFEIMKFPF